MPERKEGNLLLPLLLVHIYDHLSQFHLLFHCFFFLADKKYGNSKEKKPASNTNEADGRKKGCFFLNDYGICFQHFT